jgi:hypothetical protein
MDGRLPESPASTRKEKQGEIDVPSRCVSAESPKEGVVAAAVTFGESKRPVQERAVSENNVEGAAL